MPVPAPFPTRTIAALLLATPAMVNAAAPTVDLGPAYGYAELATLAAAAPLAVAARIATAVPLADDLAPGLAPGRRRYLIDARVTGLLAGRADLPGSVRYLADLPVDPAHPRAKARLKGVDVLLLATPGARPGELRLIGPRAQVPASAENDRRLRAILTALVAPDAPPAIVGVDRAFHVAGTLPGEGETQIFLRTADRRPISLSVLRRPGEDPRWAVALSELVDASAAPPARDTLLWFRLACGLPRALPAAATEALAADDARAATEDYAVVLAGLGSCDR